MRKILAVTVVAVLSLALAAAAVAASGLRQTAKNLFTTTRPHTSTGLTIKVDYFNPSDRSAKPPAVRRIVTRLQAGTRIDTSVPAQCDEVRALAGTCPAASRVGGGTVSIDTGFPGPNRVMVEDTTLFNARDGLLFFLVDRSSGLRTVNRASVQGNTITSLVPPLPGTPPDGGALLRIRLAIASIHHGGRAYITTPPTCPRSRRWVNRATFTYTDLVTQTVSASMPCVRASARPRFTG